MGSFIEQCSSFLVRFLSSSYPYVSHEILLMTTLFLWIRMFPLLKKDGLIIQYMVLTLFWNYLIGYNPLSLRSGSFVKLLSLVSTTHSLSQLDQEFKAKHSPRETFRRLTRPSLLYTSSN
jgi:hypothetical protein